MTILRRSVSVFLILCLTLILFAPSASALDLIGGSPYEKQHQTMKVKVEEIEYFTKMYKQHQDETYHKLRLYQASCRLDEIAHDNFREATRCLERANKNYKKVICGYQYSYTERQAATLLKAQTEFYYEQTYLVGKYAFVHAYRANPVWTEASMTRWWQDVQDVPKRS